MSRATMRKNCNWTSDTVNAQYSILYTYCGYIYYICIFIKQFHYVHAYITATCIHYDDVHTVLSSYTI